MVIKFDHWKLIGKILEVYGTYARFAEALGISEHSLSMKLGNESYFRHDEINKALSLLGIGADDAREYFFQVVSIRGRL